MTLPPTPARSRPASGLRGRALVMLAVACSLGAAASAEALARLRSMPPEQRRDLAKNLDRFDALSRDEQNALRALDRQLSETDPETRDRYESVLRRYHLWYQGLDESYRARLDAASPEDRIDVVHAILAENASGPNAWGGLSRTQKLVLLSPVSLSDQAYWIEAWRGLTPDQRKEIGRLRTVADQVARLEELATELDPPPIRAFPSMERIEGRIQEKLAARPGLQERFKNARPRDKAEVARRLAEERFLQNHEFAPVSRANLDRFLASIPPWLREAFDPLPPDAAQARLAILYRMIFPAPDEIPAAEPKAASGAAAKGAGRNSVPVAPPETGPGTPF